MNRRRALFNKLWIAGTVAAVGLAVVPLVAIIADVAIKGAAVINFDFFTKLPPPPCVVAPCRQGGLGDAVQGTLILVVLASLIGIPIGVLSGVYVSEYGANNPYGVSMRFLGDVLAGIPSIVTGALVYALVVVPLRGYSVTAGSVALGSMMIPIVSNTSAEALKGVPNSIREASHALGIRKWRVALQSVAVAKRGIATGSLLAIARITGETAVLLLTVGTSTLWFSGFGKPVATLTFYIYYFATSPYSNWKALAWGAALVLIAVVMGINALVRIVTRGKGT